MQVVDRMIKSNPRRKSFCTVDVWEAMQGLGIRVSEDYRPFDYHDELIKLVAAIKAGAKFNADKAIKGGWSKRVVNRAIEVLGMSYDCVYSRIISTVSILYADFAELCTIDTFEKACHIYANECASEEPTMYAALTDADIIDDFRNWLADWLVG